MVYFLSNPVRAKVDRCTAVCTKANYRLILVDRANHLHCSEDTRIPFSDTVNGGDLFTSPEMSESFRINVICPTLFFLFRWKLGKQLPP